jgi:hypothetical protein
MEENPLKDFKIYYDEAEDMGGVSFCQERVPHVRNAPSNHEKISPQGQLHES